MSIRLIIGSVFLALGLFIFFSSTLGLFKFRYVLDRIHATAPGDTLGVLFIVIAVAVLAGAASTTFKLIIIALFLYVTGPVSSHLIANAEVRFHDNSHGEYEKEDR